MLASSWPQVTFSQSFQFSTEFLLPTTVGAADRLSDQGYGSRSLLGDVERGLESCRSGLCPRAVSGVNTGERRTGFHRLARFGQPVHPNIWVDYRVHRQSPTAEVADDFTDETRIAAGDETTAGGLNECDSRRGVVLRELARVGIEVGILAMSISSHLRRGAPESRQAALWARAISKLHAFPPCTSR